MKSGKTISQRNGNFIILCHCHAWEFSLSLIHQPLLCRKMTPTVSLSASAFSFASSVLATLLTEHLQPSWYFQFALFPFSMYSKVSNSMPMKPSILTHRLLHQYIDQSWLGRTYVHKDPVIALHELPTHEQINGRFIWSHIEHMFS